MSDFFSSYEFYVFADIFFIIFHTLLVVFNLVAWAFKRLRIYHLISMALVSFSWFFVGILFGYGVGFCYFTKWHWEVRVELGKSTPDSYIKFLFDSITGWDSNIEIIEALTLVGFIMALGMSLYLNIRDFMRKRDKKPL